MKRIIVLGSIAVDNVTYTKNNMKPGMTVYGDSFLSNVGGKGANQACAIHFLHGDVEFYGAIGNDENGRYVHQFLNKNGVKSHLKISSQSTGIANIVIDTNTGENSIIIVPGANKDITMEDVDKIDFANKDILLLQLENDIESSIYAMKKAKEHNLLVVLNPAPFYEIPKNAYQYIDYFIPNEHELNQFTPNINGSLLDKAKYLVQEGIKNVIVTMGKNGSMLVNKDNVKTIEALSVNAIDTTAAGDSYCGALVTALSLDKSIEEAMQFATRASALTVTRKGAIASLPKFEELK